jgi:menaquinone-dependent protoporphyrinogen oxidase
MSTARILILYATVEGHTRKVAERVAGKLADAGMAAEVREATADLPDLRGYDRLVVGASVHYGHHPAWLARVIREAAGRFPSRTAFFSVSLGAKEHYATKFLRRARWQPQLTAVFAGALRYSRYGPIKRRVVQAFALVGGHDTDTSRDYEYTDWPAVDRFAAEVLAIR